MCVTIITKEITRQERFDLLAWFTAIAALHMVWAVWCIRSDVGSLLLLGYGQTTTEGSHVPPLSGGAARSPLYLMPASADWPLTALPRHASSLAQRVPPVRITRHAKQGFDRTRKRRGGPSPSPHGREQRRGWGSARRRARRHAGAAAHRDAQRLHDALAEHDAPAGAFAPLLMLELSWGSGIDQTDRPTALPI